MYYERTLEQTLRNLSETFPATSLTGPRQVGKTTLLSKTAEGGRNGRGFHLKTSIGAGAVICMLPALCPWIRRTGMYRPGLYELLRNKAPKRLYTKPAAHQTAKNAILRGEKHERIP
jgi:hypothetical protein